MQNSQVVQHSAQCPRSSPVKSLFRPAVLSQGQRACLPTRPSAQRRQVRLRAAEAVAEPPAKPADSAAVVDQVPSNVPKANQAFVASFLWLDNSIGVCVDQVFSQGQRSPVTEYFLWPKRDAWDELRAALDARSWISEADKNDLLNETTTVFEYWQEEPKHSIDDARTKFSNSIFVGS